MIVCHCNVLTRKAILDLLGDEAVERPRSPAEVQRCLGCTPRCGGCAVTVRAILREAGGRCAEACAGCSAARADANEEAPPALPLAAE